MRGTFIYCEQCGKTKAFGKPERWQDRRPCRGCNGELRGNVQATGCRTAFSLSSEFAELERQGLVVKMVRMDVEDWEWMKTKIHERDKKCAKAGTFWGARVILNGYLVPIDEEPI